MFYRVVRRNIYNTKYDAADRSFALLLSFYPIKQNGQGALSLGKANNALKGKYVVMSKWTSKGEHDLLQFIKFRIFLPLY